MAEKRIFPRIKTKIKIGYEFVVWKDSNLSLINKPVFTTTFDICARGLGIENFPEIKTGIYHKLTTGKFKIKVAIFFDNKNPPVISFARLVWSDYDPNKKYQENIKCGLNLIDITTVNFEILNNFIHSHSYKK